MNLAMLTSQIPLIELGVITSFVLMHFARTFLGLSQSSIAGTFFIVVCTILLLLPFNSLGAPWSLPLVAYVRFASVYTNFKEAKDFEQFVDQLNVPSKK